MFVPSPYNTVQVSIFDNKMKKSPKILSFTTVTYDFFVCVCLVFYKGPFPTASLGINAFLSILIVNMTPDVPNQIVPSLMSAAEAQLLLYLNQVLLVSLLYIAASTIIKQILAELRGVKIFHYTTLTGFTVFTAPPLVQTTSVCRFFPECKKMDCPFYHPKVKHYEV